MSSQMLDMSAGRLSGLLFGVTLARRNPTFCLSISTSEAAGQGQNQLTWWKGDVSLTLTKRTPRAFRGKCQSVGDTLECRVEVKAYQVLQITFSNNWSTTSSPLLCAFIAGVNLAMVCMILSWL